MSDSTVFELNLRFRTTGFYSESELKAFAEMVAENDDDIVAGSIDVQYREAKGDSREIVAGELTEAQELAIVQKWLDRGELTIKASAILDIDGGDQKRRLFNESALAIIQFGAEDIDETEGE